MKKQPELFTPVVPDEKLDPHFRMVAESAYHAPARQLMNEIWQEFYDKDGNFLEQFQTSAFDTRTFELFLFAYFSRSGYRVDCTHRRPDFIVEKESVRVAVEATTVNPTQADDDPFGLRTDSAEQLQKTLNERLPIKFGSPLFSKLRKRYWKLPHCKSLPLVFFIQSFQEEGSLYFSDASLGQYLYGMRHFPRWDRDGNLIVCHGDVTQHNVGNKIIPSEFYGQPDTEHVSAVVFCNTGTIPKFNRMAFHAGMRPSNLRMQRIGHCYHHDPNAAMPLWFEYDVAHPPVEETWGQGLSAMLNPNAAHPLPHLFFVDAAQHQVKDDVFYSDVPRFHPLASRTHVFRITERPEEPPERWLRKRRK